MRGGVSQSRSELSDVTGACDWNRVSWDVSYWPRWQPGVGPHEVIGACDGVRFPVSGPETPQMEYFWEKGQGFWWQRFGVRGGTSGTNMVARGWGKGQGTWQGVGLVSLTRCTPIHYSE